MKRLTSIDGRKWATLSDDDVYRYSLGRTWDDTLPTMAVIGVNPSTADHETDDPTIRRCVRFAADSGHGGLVMLNLFPLRATDIRDLWASEHYQMGEGNGAENVSTLRLQSKAARTVVCAWGAGSKFPAAWRGATAFIVADLRGMGIVPHVLSLTKGGDPAHPLYLPATCRPIPWSPS